MRPALAAPALFLCAALAAADDHVIEAGKFADLKYAVAKGDQLKLRVVPAPPQKADALEPGRLIFVGEPGVRYAVRGYVVNFKTEKFEEIDDTVTFGGKKADPGPKPEPKPHPPGTLFVVVVEETFQRTPETAAILNDITYWQGLKAKDVQYRFYDKDSAEVAHLGYLPHANKVGVPAVLTLDKTGKVLDVRKLTATADVDAALKGVGR